MEHVRSFTKLSIAPIQEYLAKCTEPFDTSQLYSSTEDAKFVDEDLRKSNFRTIVDPKLFSLLDDIILADINKTDNNYHYTLVKNDLTHIKYEPGGFFQRHKDYLSTTSNLIEEFTLLICVTPEGIIVDDGGNTNAVQGGNTKIFANSSSKTFDTTTPGNALLFRKDLHHEGLKLLKGEKHILTANLWAVRKEHSQQVLLVTFPSNLEGEDALTLKQLADSAFSYAIPVDNLSGMLAAHVQWVNRSAEKEGKDLQPVIAYQCRDFDYETFGVVAKIFHRSYVTEEALERSQACLDYFGPFQADNLLVDLALENQDAKKKPTNSRKKQKGVDGKAAPAEPSKKTNDGSLEEKNDFDSDVIICENEARMKVVSNAARLLKLPYVPFRILFVEGILEFHSAFNSGPSISPVEVPMTAAACLVGDYNNIFSIRNLCQSDSLKARSLQEIHSSYNVWKAMSTEDSTMQVGAVVDVNQYLDHDTMSMRENGYGLGLKIGLRGNRDIKSLVLGSVLASDPYSIAGHGTKMIVLPGLSEATNDSCDDGDKDQGEADSFHSLFHRDQKGMAAFTRKEADEASDYIASIGLDERVKASLQKKRFELPQQSGNVFGSFCNETVYGNVNILWVCGVIRLEEKKDHHCEKATEAPITFDAWPCPAVKDSIKQEMANIQAKARMAAAMNF